MSRTAPYFILPAEFHAEDLFPRSPAAVEQARYFVNLIFRKTRHYDVDSLGYARLNAKLLREVIDGRNLKKIIEALCKAGVLEVDGSYEAGRIPKGYRLAKPFLNGEIVRRRIVVPSVRARVERAWAKVREEQRTRRLPIHDALERAQQGLSFAADSDPSATITGLRKKASHACQRALARNILDREPSFHIGRTGRVFNGLSGLARPVRKLVNLDGEPMANIDLSCSQYALLGILVEAAYAGHRINTTAGPEVLLRGLSARSRDRSRVPDDVLEFVECTAEGRFYDTLLEQVVADAPPVSGRLGSKLPWTRDRVKQRAMSQILAPQTLYQRGEVGAAFEKLFPSVAVFIAEVNRTDHGTLIRLLQKVEAALVIHTVAPKLVERIPIVTLHDAIYCRAGDIQIVKAAFEEAFQELGIRIGLKVEATKMPNVIPSSLSSHTCGDASAVVASLAA